jgi:flagellar assembly factor FliW
MTFVSAHLGTIEVDESSAIEFPQGLPGFEDRRRFLLMQHPANEGLVFLQSLEKPELCFLALPARAIRGDYQLAIPDEDLEVLGYPHGYCPEIGKDVIALAVISLVEGEAPTANLLSPVVIQSHTRRAVQAIRPDDRYRCREPLAIEAAVCS